MKLFVGLALFVPLLANRVRRRPVANADCSALADLVVDGKEFGKTLELVCRFWPDDLGRFPITDIVRARELLGKTMDPGGVWDQIKQIRQDREDRGFCWRNNTLLDPSTGSGECSSTVRQQAFVVAEGVSNVYSFVSGDHRIRQAVAAITNLAEFMFDTMPPIVEAIQGALDIITSGEHGAYVAVVLFQYLQETAPDVREPAEAIRDAIQHFGDIIARLAAEQFDKGSISPLTLIRSILDHGEVMLDFAVRATKVFTHPKCSITANVAFTLEVVGDERLQGPWVQRGDINGHPRYSLVGDRSTNLEWSTANGLNRWVVFSDNAAGYIGRRILYNSYQESMDYPLTGWSAVQGELPLPTFVPVQERADR